jgi:hypothetical protein
VESGQWDAGFPTSGALEAYSAVRGAYTLLDAAERLGIEIFDGGHAFSGRKALSWMDRWL